MKVIKPAYLIASFPLTQPPPGTETSAKGCVVSTETPSVASTKGWKPMMGHFQVINSLNGEFAFHNYRNKAISMHQFDLRFWPSWVAWLPCLPLTFLIVRLGGKGSTSVIVTSGSSMLVPQTGRSRKLAILKDIIGRQRWK